jgi:hypothetical protein
MTDKKVSLLVNRQVPEFVRDEHPLFISFLEAYYEYLETKQGTQKNDLIAEAKRLKNISDVDDSLEEFESNFFNTYASLIPIDVNVSKELLIKNVLPLYLAKGSEKSFKLLFRLLFDQESTVRYPRDNILRASGAKWKIENVLRIDKQVYQTLTGNGTKTTFTLIQPVNLDAVIVYVNGSVVTNYQIRKESKKLIFNTAPANNATIRIFYSGFDFNLILNRKMTGRSSGATAVVERIDRRIIAGDNYYEAFINTKTLTEAFLNGELVDVDIFDDFGNLLYLELQSLSDVKVINIINGGASYNVGDPVVVRGPSTRQTSAIVSEVASGNIEDIDVLVGGAGFKLGNNVTANGYSTNSFSAVVETIDTRGVISPNNVLFFTNLITSINIANTFLSNLDFGFSNTANANIATQIGIALTSNVVSVGPITSINVTKSTIVSGSNPVFDVVPITIAGNVTIKDLGIIGMIDINNGGNNYVVGDAITFTNQYGDYTGRDASAIVGQVDASGSITQVKILNGGFGYTPTYFPSVTANTANGGSQANLSVACIMGDGESLQGVLADFLPGQILNIKILDSGAGYTVVPAIDLTDSGNGNATANAQIQNSYLTLPGKWTAADSLLSTEEIRLEGAEYYVNYSYVLSSKVEFNKYKEIYKRLVHPSGFISHNEFVVDLPVKAVSGEFNKVDNITTITGTVNVNSSIYITGTNTKFNIANTRGILTVGANVAINSQVRTVNSIISNTQFTVSSAFSITSNDEILVITT